MRKFTNYEELEREATGMEESYPPSWNPAQGAKLVGEITKVTLAKSLYGGVTPVLQVHDERNGEKHSLWISHAVLRQWCERERPQTGDLIWIECLGKNEKGYWEFKTVIRRKTFNWTEHLNRQAVSGSSIVEGNKDRQEVSDHPPSSPCPKDENRMFYRSPGTHDWICSVCIPLPENDAVQAEWAESLPF